MSMLHVLFFFIFVQALKWLTFLGENDHVNVLPVHNMYLKACGNAKRLADADCCLKLMESRHLGKSEITYWELLKVSCKLNVLLE